MVLNNVKWISIITVVVALAAVVTLFVGPVLAGHGDVSLAGSNFEIDTDANLVVDHAAPSIDWVSVGEVRKDDAPSGQNDDSFGQGTKEDTEVPTVVSGSIPPNKSDLKTFGVFEEVQAGGAGFMHLFWTRVQKPVGTTNMDFEFNQSAVISANGVTPVRTAGDLLIVYELSKGGTVPELFLFTWLDGTEGIACEASNTFPCWGDRETLTAAGNATGSINTLSIAAVDSDGLGNLGARTFGEASVDLDAIFDPSECKSFGSAYLKSRSSDSFTAALKDFIAPEPVDISNCGNVIIRKQTDPDGDPTSFEYTTTGGLNPAGFFLSDDGVQDYGNVVLAGDYTVTELVPAGWDLSDISCSTTGGATAMTNLGTGTVDIAVTPDGSVDCTYTNVARGNIAIAKVTDPAGDPATFDFTGDVSGTLGDGGSASAEVVPGNYASTETVPAGWDLTNISCGDADSSGDLGTTTANFVVSAGETVTCTFTNVKRGTIIVEKQTNPDGAAGPFTFTGDASGTIGDDGTIVVGDLAPGVYTSTENDPTGAGFRFDSISCDDANSSGDVPSRTATFNLDPGETVTCTFTNSTGAILISKTAKNYAAGGVIPQEGVSFAVDTGAGIINAVTDASGLACVDELVPGVDHTVTETVPGGYAVDSPNPQVVNVSAGATCASGTPDDASFVNNPLSAITIGFDSLAGPGVTVATSVTCTGPSANGSGQGPLADGQSVTLTALLEGTYTCTIVVDP